MNRKILVGVCGSIAAYKICEVIRMLKKSGWDVKVVMTENSTRFISTLTLSTLSENLVYADMFDRQNIQEGHISLSKYPGIMLIAPATASTIGKIASGICDNLLTCTVFAFTGPVIIAPAMNTNMWLNNIVQDNVKKLKKAGYFFVEPDEGPLACGSEGPGRLAALDKIVSAVNDIADREKNR